MTDRRITASKIEGLGPKMVREVGEKLDKVNDGLPDLQEVESANFTTVIPSMAVAYAMAAEVFEAQLKRQWELLDQIHDRLKGAARAWEDVEKANTADTFKGL
ncbi:hypothetical protein [Phytomonospora endophytica]|uniref:Flagellin-specific chaperone FliS n=1 Tax=Phytomonospora endophytica TaxID=714109 RepID=A0A841FSG3_9ACTN|nr:hypothetical protein [Phytomonospora endophytica]MBB6034910.1 flagellin-specific chaperone FliS [Phytomonospora endophytica]GIG70614.1 hypothetical protein Pen01_69090 [Phytomonospora endophytica]